MAAGRCRSPEGATTSRDADFLEALSAPARRALANAGYTRIEQFTELSEAEVRRLHGMGPKGVELIRRALAAKGLSFSD